MIERRKFLIGLAALYVNSVPRLARAEKDRIMGGNAARLLKIKR